jgi:hypothetical protein
MTPEDVEHALAALSARQMALESLLAAVIAHATIDRAAALADFDAAAAQVRDQYFGGCRWERLSLISWSSRTQS